MLLPAVGCAPPATLRDLANKLYNGSVPILGAPALAACALYSYLQTAHAAASNASRAVKMLLQLGADPLATGTIGKNAIEFCNQVCVHVISMFARIFLFARVCC
jgi:hypothetical protein